MYTILGGQACHERSRMVMAEYDDNRQLLVWRMGSFGYKTPDGKSYYYLKDHLGNIRVTVNENKEIVSKNDYYPFGMQMPGMCYNEGNSNDRYKYSSKELETMGSLSKYHYGFR
ncbi:hypothetical protein ACX8XN_08540 [Calditrichota bacterium GD2]